MIHLANDPNASRLSWRPKAQGDKAAEAPRRGRPGHAWPFLSPQVRRPDRAIASKTSPQDSGS